MVNFEDLSFDAVIPSALLLNENLEPNAIKLYAFVRGLTRAHGYCYATNAYLAECMKCDESTVKRLLLSLKKEGFLEIHTDKQGVHWQRHIFLSDGFKKYLRRLKNELPPAQNQATPSSKMSYNKGYRIEDIEKEEPPNPLKGEVGERVSFDKIILEKKDYEKLCSTYGKLAIEGLIQEMNDYLASTGKKPYKDYAAALRNWIRRRNLPELRQDHIKVAENIDTSNFDAYFKESPLTEAERISKENLDWVEAKVYANKACRELMRKGRLRYQSGILEIDDVPEARFYFKDGHAFREQVKNALRKMEIIIDEQD